MSNSNNTNSINEKTTELSSEKNSNSENKFTKETINELGNKVRLSDKDETNNLELYCYTYCDNNSPEELKNCRGVVFNDNKIILQAFPYTEELVPDRDLNKIKDVYRMNNIRIYDSYEGALIRMFNYNDKWYISTHRKLNAFESKWASNESFGTCFKRALYEEIKKNKELSDRISTESSERFLEKFENTLDKDRQYMFIVRNNVNNRIVCIPPDNPQLFHVGTFIDNKLDLDDNIYVKKPNQIKFQKCEDMLEYIHNIDYMKKQGVIVFTENNKQYKIVNVSYDELFNARGNQPSIPFRYVQVRMDSKMVDKLYYLYPDSIKKFEEYESIIYEIGKNIYKSYVDRYIKKQYVSLAKEEFLVMKACHSWHLENRRTNRISLNLVLKNINNQLPTSINRMIKRYKNNIRIKNKIQQDKLNNETTDLEQIKNNAKENTTTENTNE